MSIKNKNISFQANALLDKLIEEKQLCFDVDTAHRILSASNRDAVKQLLSNMTKRGLLMRIKEGLYYTVPYEQILIEFNRLFDFIREEANINMRVDGKKLMTHESGSLQIYIDYVASLQGNMGSRDLKIDITRGEILETAFEIKTIFRNYSDLEEDFQLKCYSLAEVLIEKMTALMGRTEPRDLYDFWYLTELAQIDIAEHLFEFRSKAQHKKQDPQKFMEKVLSKEIAFKRDGTGKLPHKSTTCPNLKKSLEKQKDILKCNIQ
jgi:predicted nucleotidyltransferase component of viral defense system